MAELSKKLYEMTFDGLVVDTAPPVVVTAGVLKGGDKKTLKRGTLLVRGEDGKLTAYASGNKADCVLCDDVDLDSADLSVPVYVGGCFNPDKLIVAGGNVDEALKADLAAKGILTKSAN